MFNITLPKTLQPYFNNQIKFFELNMSNDNYIIAWKSLEKAHVIGQKYVLAHTYVHWKMLMFGFEIKSKKEILGQIPRLIFGGIKSFIGKVPLGNTGGSNVPALKSFPLDKEIVMIFEKAGISI